MDILLTLHGWIRWLVLAGGGLGLVAVAVKRPRLAAIAGTAFLALLDVQLLLGALAAVLDRESRATAAPHVILMGAAVVLAHALRVWVKRRGPGGPLRAASLFALPLLFILVGLWALE